MGPLLLWARESRSVPHRAWVAATSLELEHAASHPPHANRVNCNKSAQLSRSVPFFSYSHQHHPTPLPHFDPLLPTISHCVNPFLHVLLKSYSQVVHRPDDLLLPHLPLVNIGRDAPAPPHLPQQQQRNHVAPHVVFSLPAPGRPHIPDQLEYVPVLSPCHVRRFE